MPHKTWLVGEEVVQADYQANVADQIIATFANAAARTAGWPTPPTGAYSYLVDTPGVLWTYYAGAWKSPQANGLITYLDNSTDLNVPPNSSIDLAGMLYTFNPPAGRKILITLSVQFGVSAGTPSAALTAAIADGANNPLKDRGTQLFTSGSQNMAQSCTVHYLHTATGSTVTFKGRAANQTPGATAIYAQDQTMIFQDVGGS